MTLTPEYTLALVVTFGLALGLSVALTRFARRLAPRFGLLAYPGGRRQHPEPIAKLGALPLWGAFTLTALVAQWLPVPRQDPKEIIRLTGLLVGGTVIFVVGLLDDKYDLPWWGQIIGQLVAAAIAVACLIFIERFNNPVTGDLTPAWPYVITVIISLLWLGLMMNTVNFLDGVDGLAGGVNFIAAALLFIHTLREGQLSVSLLPLALMGAALGFLLFNWNPASIFMGSGAVYLGYIIGALAIIGGAKMATILLVMGLPLLDLAWQAARRLSAGKNPFKGDRGHLHFRLVDAGLHPRTLAIGYYLFCAGFGLLALVTTSRQFKLIGLLAMIGLAFLGFALVGRRAASRRDGQPKEAQSEVSS